MEIKRTIVIGDIHGCRREFEDMLEHVKFRQGTDRMILAGDLINKGPDSRGVLQLAKSIAAETILGNHELGFLRRFDRGDDHPVIDELGCEVKKWAAWMKTWPLFIKEKDFIVVHAGISPGRRLESMNADVLTKIRTWDGDGNDLQNPLNPPWYKFYHQKKLIIYGHWATRGLVIRDNVIGLDSGCVYGKKLSAVILPQRKIVQVPARKVYCKS